ncbi:hypothetical protein [Methanomethylovorans sp.]
MPALRECHSPGLCRKIKETYGRAMILAGLKFRALRCNKGLS